MQKFVTNFTEEHKEQNQNKSIQSFKVHKLKNASSFRLNPVTLKLVALGVFSMAAFIFLKFRYVLVLVMSCAKFEAFNADVSKILEFGIELFVSYRYCILL